MGRSIATLDVVAIRCWEVVCKIKNEGSEIVH